ncbi:MAG: rod shape-determining protein RodA [Deltaproteobacteria bacterium]|nr:rod shape-determining protein RodA [Candidatus Tharpella aukensis]
MDLSKRTKHRPHQIDPRADAFAPWPKNYLTEQPLDRNRLYDFDYLTLGLTFILVFLGILTIYSATYNPEAGSWLTGYCRKQCIWFGISLVVGSGLFIFHYNFLYQLSYPLYGVGLILLLAVEVAGSQHMGATRWLSIGGINVQPSEFAKLSVILALARYLSNRSLPPPYNLKELLMPIIIVALPTILILKQPDLGTAMLIILISGVIIFIAGITRGTIVTISISALTTAFVGWHFLHDYQRQRILTFINPENDPLGSGYHIAQSKIAIGAGKLFGKGFLKGTQNSLHFLPEQHTDFIFAAYAEQWGFLGTIILLALYFAFLFRALNIAMEARDSFGSYLATGIAAIFFWQVTINIGMVSGLMPVVGIPLPLFSYGGTSMLTSVILISILLNIHYRRKA